MTSVSWMENNHQKPNESNAAFVTRVQNAVATTSREAITNKAKQHLFDEFSPFPPEKIYFVISLYVTSDTWHVASKGALDNAFQVGQAYTK
jgi:hypothetical protein